MKPLFQQQCEALVKTLTKAKADENARLNMLTWVINPHSCGTAACVCGYQVLSSDLSLFERAMECDAYSGNDDYDYDYDDISEAIAYDLRISCKELFGDNYLARSIFMASARNRFCSALEAQVAGRETLETFNHLTTRKPTLDDAIEYIEFVIEKCKEQAA